MERSLKKKWKNLDFNADDRMEKEARTELVSMIALGKAYHLEMQEFDSPSPCLLRYLEEIFAYLHQKLDMCQITYNQKLI